MCIINEIMCIVRMKVFERGAENDTTELVTQNDPSALFTVGSSFEATVKISFSFVCVCHPMIGSGTDSNAAVKETRHFLGDYFAVVSVSLKVDTALIKLASYQIWTQIELIGTRVVNAHLFYLYWYNRLVQPLSSVEDSCGALDRTST